VEQPEADPVENAHRQWVAHGWAEAADGMAAVTSLIRVHRALLAGIDEILRDLELTFARYELLVLLYFSRTGALPSSTICAQLEVHQTTVSIIIGRLEKQGLVSRVPHPSDGRSRLISLTAAGRDLVVRATERLNSSLFAEEFFTSAQVEELRWLRRQLLALRAR
jgi:DNA-binding MarR family transcriptional regulator